MSTNLEMAQACRAPKQPGHPLFLDGHDCHFCHQCLHLLTVLGAQDQSTSAVARHAARASTPCSDYQGPSLDLLSELPFKVISVTLHGDGTDETTERQVALLKEMLLHQAEGVASGLANVHVDNELLALRISHDVDAHRTMIASLIDIVGYLLDELMVLLPSSFLMGVIHEPTRPLIALIEDLFRRADVHGPARLGDKNRNTV